MSPNDTTPGVKGFRNKRNTPFTMLANAMLRDHSLTLRAKGLLAVMLSFPDDWQYHLSHIETLSSDGRDGHRSAVRELEAAGYIRRHQTRDGRGRVSSSVYTVSDEVLTVDGLTGDGAPVAGQAATTNTDYTNTDYTKKKDGTQKPRAGQEQPQFSDEDNKNNTSPCQEPRETAGKGTGQGDGTNKKDVPPAAPLDIPPVLLARPGWEESWGAWLAYRRGRKLTLNPMTLKAQLHKLAAEPDPIAVIEQSITNGWAGLFPLKAERRQPQDPNTRAVDTATRVYRAITEEPDNVPF